MFDVGFWELVLIAVVALLVIGPEKLPSVARTAGLWMGRARKFVTSVKADIDRELKAEELQQILKEQARVGEEIHELVEQTRSTVEEAGREEPPAPASEREPEALAPSVEERPHERSE